MVLKGQCEILLSIPENSLKGEFCRVKLVHRVDETEEILQTWNYNRHKDKRKSK